MPDQNTTVDTNTAANAGAWAESFDADTKGWVAGKGWDKLDASSVLPELVKGYRGAEQRLGVPADQLLRLPGKDAKPEDWKQVWTKLGAPENPEGYEIQAPEGDPGEFMKAATGWFHELGVPKSMAQGLAAKWNEYGQVVQEQQVGQWNQRFDNEVAELKNEWKVDYDKHIDLSNRVLRAAGFTPEQQMAIERALGPKAFRQAFAKFGTLVGEHRFAGNEGQGQGGFQMSPEAARARIQDLQKDTAWRQAFLNGDADKKAEWTRLHEVAFPQQQAA